jgi:hypothetical protein
MTLLNRGLDLVIKKDKGLVRLSQLFPKLLSK